MARKTTLTRLMDIFRAEARLSTNPAHNASTYDSQLNLLQRVQETLWEDFDWPHLRVQRDIPIEAGQRYYDPPEDLDIQRIERVEFFYGGEWVTINAGIGVANYLVIDSEADARSWPVERWQLVEDEQIELWPIPDQTTNTTSREGTLRVTGIRKLNPLVNGSDRTDLDDRMIALFAAAEYLASRGEKDAKLKLDGATKRYLKLRGQHGTTKSFKLFGGANRSEWHRRGPPRVHYRIGP